MFMMYVWIALTVIFVVIEMATVQLMSIWFVLGAVAAEISYFAGAGIAVQITVFVLVSAAALVITRPLVRKFTRAKIQPTNADSNIGLEAVVTKEIDNLYSEGTVKLKGLEWTARSENGEKISVGETVLVKSIEGVKLIVERKI